MQEGEEKEGTKEEKENLKWQWRNARLEVVEDSEKEVKSIYAHQWERIDAEAWCQILIVFKRSARISTGSESLIVALCMPIYLVYGVVLLLSNELTVRLYVYNSVTSFAISFLHRHWSDWNYDLHNCYWLLSYAPPTCIDCHLELKVLSSYHEQMLSIVSHFKVYFLYRPIRAISVDGTL